MKLTSLCLPLIILFSRLSAQSIDDAKKQVYYQHFNEAKSILKALVNQPNASPDARPMHGTGWENYISNSKNLILLKKCYKREQTMPASINSIQKTTPSFI
jgi:hypothetical protein